MHIAGGPISYASSEVMHTVPYHNVTICNVCKVPSVPHVACQHYSVRTLGINQWKSIFGKIELWVGNFSVCIKRICIHPLNLIIFTLEPSWFPDFICIKWGNASSEVCIKWGITVIFLICTTSFSFLYFKCTGTVMWNVYDVSEILVA